MGYYDVEQKVDSYDCDSNERLHIGDSDTYDVEIRESEDGVLSYTQSRSLVLTGQQDPGEETHYIFSLPERDSELLVEIWETDAGFTGTKNYNDLECTIGYALSGVFLKKNIVSITPDAWK